MIGGWCNVKDLEKCGRGLSKKFSGRRGKSRENSIKIAGAPTGIRKEHLLNARAQRFLYTNLFEETSFTLADRMIAITLNVSLHKILI
jgi:hypothetical protein